MSLPVFISTHQLFAPSPGELKKRFGKKGRHEKGCHTSRIVSYTRRNVSPYTNISITNSSTEDRRRVATPSEEEGWWIKQGGLRQDQQKRGTPGKLGGKISRSAVSSQQPRSLEVSTSTIHIQNQHTHTGVGSYPTPSTKAVGEEANLLKEKAGYWGATILPER